MQLPRGRRARAAASSARRCPRACSRPSCALRPGARRARSPANGHRPIDTGRAAAVSGGPPRCATHYCFTQPSSTRPPHAPDIGHPGGRPRHARPPVGAPRLFLFRTASTRFRTLAAPLPSIPPRHAGTAVKREKFSRLPRRMRSAFVPADPFARCNVAHSRRTKIVIIKPRYFFF